MRLALERRFAVGTAVIAVGLLGAGAANACDGGGHKAVRAETATFASFRQTETSHAGLRMHMGWAWGRGFLAATASYLGTTPQALKTELASGKTIAQVAPAGTSPSGLAAAWLAAAKTKLDAAVAAGRITSTQESAWLSMLSSKLTNVANAVWTMSWTGMDRDNDGDGH